MWILWGQTTEIKDLGVVAEQCPCCERITPCSVRTIFEADHVFFVKVAEASKETSSLCSVCGGSFACQLWRYPNLVPGSEAAGLPVETLLARTNPGLVERVQMKQQVIDLGGDDRFAVAYEQLEGMRPGELHAGLLKQLLDWGRLEDEHRVSLVCQVEACSRAWRLARQVAPGFPGHAGCLSAFLVALIIWSTFFWLPLVRSWLWGTVTVLGGCGAAALTGHILLGRRVRRWTREVLVPEAQRANVSLPCFLTVVDDLPDTRFRVLEDLWPVKDQLETIRLVLIEEGRV